MKEIDNLSYSGVLKSIDNKQPCNLLIGNGFSIALDDAFKINESMNETVGNRLSDLFSLNAVTIGNEMAEEIAKTLSENDHSILKLRINEKVWKNNYRNVMFWEVVRKHPESIRMIRDGEVRACMKFLSTYLGSNGKIFTTNYDLMLYWSFVKAREIGADEGLSIEYADGFDDKRGNRLYWKENDKQNIFYCHGALNINGDGRACFKSSHDMLSVSPLISRFFDNDEKPIVVSAESAGEKEAQIEEYDYLRSCFEHLSSLRGSLVILGLSLTQNDDHIIDALIKAQKDNDLRIFYGCFSQDDYGNMLDVVSRTSLRIEGYFQSGTVDIWRTTTSVTMRRGKYAPLEKELKNRNKDGKEPFKLSFSEIERIIKTTLPPSAYKYASVWWTDNHPYASAWINAGYKAHADKKNKSVTFTKRQ